jgi:hypothetical protein
MLIITFDISGGLFWNLYSGFMFTRCYQIFGAATDVPLEKKRVNDPLHAVFSCIDLHVRFQDGRLPVFQGGIFYDSRHYRLDMEGTVSMRLKVSAEEKGVGP